VQRSGVAAELPERSGRQLWIARRLEFVTRSKPGTTERDSKSATLCDPLPNNFPPEGIRRKTWS
jgi:hypothetical protein